MRSCIFDDNRKKKIHPQKKRTKQIFEIIKRKFEKYLEARLDKTARERRLITVKIYPFLQSL
jgi:hypothetical protein